MVVQFERQIAELEQQLSQREQQNTKASNRGKELTSFKMRWRDGKRAPRGMSRLCDAIANSNTVCVRNRNTVEIYSYDVTSDSWSRLPDCIHAGGPITIISGWLIVAGGWGEGDRALSTIEVMNTENHQWSTAADLLKPLYSASATVYGDQLYMLGGADNNLTYTKSGYTCTVSALLQSCAQSSLEAKLERTSKPEYGRRVADLPLYSSTCEFFHG